MKRAFGTALVLLGCLVVGGAAWAIRLGQKMPNFRLKDSHGKVYTLDSFKEPVLVVWYEGKNSKEQNRWIKKKLKALRKAGILSSKKYRSIGIANFQETAVPNFIIKAVIKDEIRKTGAIILCDTDGHMQKLWGFRNGRSNIYVLDKERRLRWRTSGPLDKRHGNQLIRLILRLTRQY